MNNRPVAGHSRGKVFVKGAAVLVGLLATHVMGTGSIQAAERSSDSSTSASSRGFGSVQYASLKKRPNAPKGRRTVLRLFTGNSDGHNVSASKRNAFARARYQGQNNGFGEWHVRPGDSRKARKLIGILADGVRGGGRISFLAATRDPTFPTPSPFYKCRLTGFDKLDVCREQVG